MTLDTLCHFCDEPININTIGAYRQVTGWAQIRSQGGTGSLAMTSEPHAWAHGKCIQSEKLKKSGRAIQTERLF